MMTMFKRTTIAKRLLICVIGLTILAACAGRDSRDSASADASIRDVKTDRLGAKQALDQQDGNSASDEEAASAQDGLAEGPVLNAGTGVFINEDAANRREAIPETGEITLNFEGQPIQEAVKTILGDLLGQNYVIGPGVSGRVTFSTAKPIKRDQLMPVLEMLLSWNGAALVYADGRYNVLPKNNAVAGNLVPRTDDVAKTRGYEVRAVPLEYISVSEMEAVLTPFVAEGAIVRTDSARNMLFLAGTRKELTNYLQTINTFDVDWLEGMSVGMYPLRRVEAQDVVEELGGLFGEEGGSPLAGMFRFMAIERLNAVLVITHQEDYLEKAGEWIKRLDQGGNEAGSRIYVYNVQNVKATDLADTLSGIFGGGSSSRDDSRVSRRGSVGPGQDQLEIGSVQGDDVTAGSGGQRSAQNSSQRRSGAGGSGVAVVEGEDVKITAVEENNAIVIRSSPAQYEAIMGAVRQLDVVPLQVLVEVKVVEVRLTDDLNYGVQWYLENGVNRFVGVGEGSGDSGNGGDNTTSSKGLDSDFFDGNRQTNQAALLSGNGLAYSFLGTDAGVIIQALSNIAETRILSAPTLMVLNNSEAKINVGQQIPVNSPIVNIGSGSEFSQTRVQFRDTGAILSVTPRVNPGGLVFLEIEQELSDPLPAEADQNGNVPLRKRTITTEVAVDSGETITLGGLIRQTDSEGRAGVPLLKDLPLLGGLFSTTRDDHNREELLVMIKPTVITSAREAREVSKEFSEKFRGLKPLNASEAKELNIDLYNEEQQ